MRLKKIIAVMLTSLLLLHHAAASENPLFRELLDRGVEMSDGTFVKLPPPILADDLDAAEQKSALAKALDSPTTLDALLQKSFYAPVVVKVRTLKPPTEESPGIRTVDCWFVLHGDWGILTSADFLESALKTSEEGKSRVLLRSGVLNETELAARNLSPAKSDAFEEKFTYATVVLFERVELSATRKVVLTRGPDWVLAAAAVAPNFSDDKEYPNCWRSLLRDERAEIKLGPPYPFAHAGGYAKLTRLKEPSEAIFVECHLAYEEDYGWFDGANLVRQKAPLMVQEKVRTVRRKLALASAEKTQQREETSQKKALKPSAVEP